MACAVLARPVVPKTVATAMRVFVIRMACGPSSLPVTLEATMVPFVEYNALGPFRVTRHPGSLRKVLLLSWLSRLDSEGGWLRGKIVRNVNSRVTGGQCALRTFGLDPIKLHTWGVDRQRRGLLRLPRLQRDVFFCANRVR